MPNQQHENTEGDHSDGIQVDKLTITGLHAPVTASLIA